MSENWLFRDKDGKPFMPIGVQAHNSSTGSAFIRKALRTLELFGGNTLEAPAYWYFVEPEEGVYDFSSVKDLIDEVREAGAHLVILWFGMSKNGHPNYVPEYVKLHPEIYHVAKGHDARAVASLSPHCMATLERDKAAFLALLQFVKDYDEKERTVIAIQIENEMGYANTDRDYSEEAEADYQKAVPEEIAGLRFPDMWGEEASDGQAAGEGNGDNAVQQKICGAGNGKPGDENENAGVVSPWKTAFGRYSHEAFSAWYTAQYIEKIAKAGKALYDIPFYTNVFVGENAHEEAGLCYNAGAGVSRMLELWKIAAPSLDLIAPDIYNTSLYDYRRICASYKRFGNPLFVPESPVSGMPNAMNLILAAGEFEAQGVASFGAEGALDENENLNPESEEIALSMHIIAKIAPLLIQYHGTGRIHAFTQEEFEPWRYLKLPLHHVVMRYTSCNSQGFGYTTDVKSKEGRKKIARRGRAILVQTGDYEFYMCGGGAMAEFIRRPDPMDEDSYGKMSSRYSSQLNFLSVDEGHFENGEFVCDFRRNGDETNFAQYVLDGQLIRIRLNPCVE